MFTTKHFISKGNNKKIRWDKIQTIEDAGYHLNINFDHGYKNFIEKLIYSYNKLFYISNLSDDNFLHKRCLYIPIVKLSKEVDYTNKILAQVAVNYKHFYTLIQPEKDEIPEVNGLFNYDESEKIGYCSLHVTQYGCINKDIAFHISKYFSTELFMAMCLHSDFINDATQCYKMDIKTINSYINE